MSEQVEAQLARGEQVNIADVAALSSTLVRLSSRIGVDRRAKPAVPSLDAYLDARSRDQDDDDDGDVIDGHAEAAE